MVTKANRPRGTGSLYKQPGSKNWFIQFYHNGKKERESTGTDNLRQAKAYLRDKMGEASQGTYTPKANQVTVADLADAKLTSDTVNSSDSLDTTQGRWKLHLQPFLGNMKACNITTALLNRYIAHRQAEKAANATINRELAFLRSAFNLARKSGTLRLAPYFPMVKEPPPRKGFLTDGQCAKLAQACAAEGPWLRAILEVGAKFAWRRGSVQTLKVGQIDFSSNTIRLEADQTKNDEAVIAVMPKVMRELLTACCTGKAPSDPVFTYTSGHRMGQPVKDYRRAWNRAIKAAGLPDLIVHDLCRTGMRDMRRRGIDKDVAMKIAGRKTASIFRRYNIVDENDLADAAVKMDKQLPGQQASQLGHSLDIVQPVEEAVENNFKVQVVIAQ